LIWKYEISYRRLQVGDLGVAEPVDPHGLGRTPAGVLTRIWQRVLALTAVTWHNEAAIGQRVKRSLTDYDH
jgi:hypothetical protein